MSDKTVPAIGGRSFEALKQTNEFGADNELGFFVLNQGSHMSETEFNVNWFGT